MGDVISKTREQRLAEIQARLVAVKDKPANVPYITTDGKLNNGKITLLLDVLALEDGMHTSSTGNSQVNFTTLELSGLGRFNVNCIRK